MKNKIICDSNFLIGLFDEKDKRHKIPYLASFDEDFDKVKGIKRIGHKKDLEILEDG